jgi:hypothetical protein
MTRQLRKATFAAVMLLWVLFGNYRAKAYSEEFCTCYWDTYPVGNAYIYETYWEWVDYVDFYQAYYMPNGSAPECDALCFDYGAVQARGLCQTYGNANHHVQIELRWHFEDSDNSNGGTDQGFISTGSSIIMCSSL